VFLQADKDSRRRRWTFGTQILKVAIHVSRSKSRMKEFLSCASAFQHAFSKILYVFLQANFIITNTVNAAFIDSSNVMRWLLGKTDERGQVLIFQNEYD
jgi:hypothetical protein